MMDFGQAWTYLTHNTGGWLKTGSAYAVSRDGMHVEVEASDDSDELVVLSYSEFGKRFRTARFVEIDK